MSMPQSLATVENLTWFISLLASVITLMAGVIVYFGKQKVFSIIKSLKTISEFQAMFQQEYSDDQKSFVMFKEKVLADIRVLFDRIENMRKQVDKIDDIQIKVEKSLIIAESQKERIDGYGKVVKK